MVVVNSRQRIAGERRAEDIVRFVIANRLPQGRQQFGRHLQAGLARRLAVRQSKQLELVPANPRGRRLLRQSNAPRLLPRAEMMSRFPVGADKHFGLECNSQFSPPQLKRAGRRELVIIEVRVDKEDFHVETRRR